MSKQAAEVALKHCCALCDKDVRYCGLRNSPRTCTVCKLFIFGYEQAEKDLGWVSVKDRLPEKDEVVLTCWDVNGVPQGIGLRMYIGYWLDFDEDDEETADPDYWMPVPTKVREGEK